MPTELLVPACRLKGNKTKVDQIMDKLPSWLSDMFKSALVARRQAGSCRRLTNISHVHGRLVIFLKHPIFFMPVRFFIFSSSQYLSIVY